MITYHVNASFHERLELHRFPLDRQFLNMEMKIRNTDEGWTWLGVCPRWVPDTPDKLRTAIRARLGDSVSEYRIDTPWADYSCTLNSDEARLRMRIERISAFYVGNVILPVFLVVGACFISIAEDRFSPADRLSITLSLMLTMVAFRFVTNAWLPRNAYLTWMDSYMIVAFIFISIFVVENVVMSFDTVPDKIEEWFFIVSGSFWFLWHVFVILAMLDIVNLRVSWEKQDLIDSVITDDFWSNLKTDQYGHEPSQRWTAPDDEDSDLEYEIVS